MNAKSISIFVALVALIIIAIFTMSEGVLTPYVPFDKAKNSPGEMVQIIGKLDRSREIRHAEKSYTFTILSEKDNQSIEISHNGIMPMNFQQAEEIVAIGKYNGEKKIFEASKVLTKCPSKYQKGKIK